MLHTSLAFFVVHRSKLHSLSILIIMAKDKETQETDASEYSAYPIRTLFQVGGMFAAVTFVLSMNNKALSFFDIAVRSFLVFAGVAGFGGVLMVIIVSIISNMKFKEAEAARQQIEEEQQEFMDSQLKLQEEIERLARESLTINQDDMQS